MINNKQEGFLLEMCEDLFSEYDKIEMGDNCAVIFENGEEKVVVDWFQLCFFEIPKRLAENSNTVDTKGKQYSIFESMAKRMLGIHALYKDVKPKHPVEYLYKIFSKL